ncbi:MAG: hypothetical protein IPO06_19835 [Leptospiraceae bacterium]|nr:hypothetical protein [Leptospiraceae bacterium]MBP9889837.1 hypothetical protein [Leptospiraceae bacterium]
MTTTPRKFDSEIRITESGKWLFRGGEITQDNVLGFFKKNIREDDLGIYITNTYAEFTEHGYLDTKVIFLKIIDSVQEDNNIYLIGEEESKTNILDFYFYSDLEEKIFCMRKSDQFIKFTFNRQMHSYISSLMIEENGNYFLQTNEEKIPVIPFTKPIEVNIPEKFKV